MKKIILFISVLILFLNNTLASSGNEILNNSCNNISLYTKYSDISTPLKERILILGDKIHNKVISKSLNYQIDKIGNYITLLDKIKKERTFTAKQNNIIDILLDQFNCKVTQLNIKVGISTEESETKIFLDNILNLNDSNYNISDRNINIEDNIDSIKKLSEKLATLEGEELKFYIDYIKYYKSISEIDKKFIFSYMISKYGIEVDPILEYEKICPTGYTINKNELQNSKKRCKSKIITSFIYSCNTGGGYNLGSVKITYKGVTDNFCLWGKNKEDVYKASLVGDIYKNGQINFACIDPKKLPNNYPQLSDFYTYYPLNTYSWTNVSESDTKGKTWWYKSPLVSKLLLGTARDSQRFNYNSVCWKVSNSIKKPVYGFKYSPLIKNINKEPIKISCKEGDMPKYKPNGNNIDKCYQFDYNKSRYNGNVNNNLEVKVYALGFENPIYRTPPSNKSKNVSLLKITLKNGKKIAETKIFDIGKYNSSSLYTISAQLRQKPKYCYDVYEKFSTTEFKGLSDRNLYASKTLDGLLNNIRTNLIEVSNNISNAKKFPINVQTPSLCSQGNAWFVFKPTGKLLDFIAEKYKTINTSINTNEEFSYKCNIKEKNKFKNIKGKTYICKDVSKTFITQKNVQNTDVYGTKRNIYPSRANALQYCTNLNLGYQSYTITTPIRMITTNTYDSVKKKWIARTTNTYNYSISLINNITCTYKELEWSK